MSAIRHRARFQWDRTFENARGPHHFGSAEGARQALIDDEASDGGILRDVDFTKDFFEEGFDWDVGVGD